MLRGSNLQKKNCQKYDIFEILSVLGYPKWHKWGQKNAIWWELVRKNFRVSNHQLSSKKIRFIQHDTLFFVIICQIYALFSLIFGQLYEGKLHYKSTRHFTTKYRKIIFFVSNKSYDIGLPCNTTYFTTTITSYAVEGVAIVFLHPVEYSPEDFRCIDMIIFSIWIIKDFRRFLLKFIYSDHGNNHNFLIYEDTSPIFCISHTKTFLLTAPELIYAGLLLSQITSIWNYGQVVLWSPSILIHIIKSLFVTNKVVVPLKIFFASVFQHVKFIHI